MGLSSGPRGMGVRPSGEPQKVTIIDTPHLVPMKVANSINQLFGERGINATEAPDGESIVLTSPPKADLSDVKSFIIEYVNKAEVRIQEQNKFKKLNEIRMEEMRKKKEDENRKSDRIPLPNRP